MNNEIKTNQHCCSNFNEWEQRVTCYHCGKPLSDNELIKDAYKMNTVNTWAKVELTILADMAEHRGNQWFADQMQNIANKLLFL